MEECNLIKNYLESSTFLLLPTTTLSILVPLVNDNSRDVVVILVLNQVVLDEATLRCVPVVRFTNPLAFGSDFPKSGGDPVYVAVARGKHFPWKTLNEENL